MQFSTFFERIVTRLVLIYYEYINIYIHSILEVK